MDSIIQNILSHVDPIEKKTFEFWTIFYESSSGFDFEEISKPEKEKNYTKRDHNSNNNKKSSSFRNSIKGNKTIFAQERVNICEVISFMLAYVIQYLLDSDFCEGLFSYFYVYTVYTVFFLCIFFPCPLFFFFLIFIYSNLVPPLAYHMHA